LVSIPPLIITALPELKCIKSGLQACLKIYDFLRKSSLSPYHPSQSTLLFSKTVTMGAVGLIFPLALTGVPLSVPKWLVLETSTIESVVAVFIDNNDEDEDEGRLEFPGLSGGEKSCAVITSDKEDEKNQKLFQVHTMQVRN
jgi:hypothetical protein